MLIESIRILILENEPEYGAHLRDLFQAVALEVEPKSYADVQVFEKAGEAIAAAEAAGKGNVSSADLIEPYDLIILDVDLDDPNFNGLDVLAKFRDHAAAWMAVVLTGLELSRPGDDSIAPEGQISKLRKTLRSEANRRFPGERLTVMDKPFDPSLLRGRVEQVLGLYHQLNAMRFVFRPIEVQSTNSRTQLWQIRYDCGDLITMPPYAGFDKLRDLLAGNSILPERREPSGTSDNPRGKVTQNSTPSTTATKSHSRIPDAVEELCRYAQQTGQVLNEDTSNDIRGQMALDLDELMTLMEVEFLAEADGEKLGDDDYDRIEILKHVLGPIAAGLAERKARLKCGLEENDHDISEETERGWALINTGGAGVAGRKKGSKRAPPTDKEKKQGHFRAWVKRWRLALEKYGFQDMSDHLEVALKSSRGKGWHYGGGKKWTT